MINAKVATRLYVLAGCGFALIIAVSLMGVIGMMMTHTKLQHCYEEGAVALKRMGVITKNFERNRLNISKLLISKDKAEAAERTQLIDGGIKTITEQWTIYTSGVLPEQQRKFVSKVQMDREAFVSEALQPILSSIRNDRYDEAREIYDNKFRPLSDVVEKDFDSLSEMMTARAKDDYEHSQKTISFMKILILIVTVVGSIAMTVAATLVIKGIMKPLTDGIHVMRRISDGDLAVHIAPHGKDETCQLLAAMGEMAANLNGMIKKIKQSADMVATSSDRLKTSAEQMSLGANEQSRKSAQIATSATQMSQTVIDIARNASNIAYSASETAKEAKDGEAIVDKSIVEVKGIAQAVGESAALISSLGEHSRQIGDIVKVIKDIADQTNLLALNAAIEAARAGDQGRGFAVVADEVRKLAERTTKATTEISKMIISIQDGTKMAVSSMEGATVMVETGVENVSSAGESLHKIVASISSLQVMVEQIASATEEMSSVSETITSDIESIANVSQETSLSSDHIAHSASDLSDLSFGLQQIVGQFKVSDNIDYSGGNKPPLQLL
ncbi:MAG: methyl-accepting chemotaxis protein [Candidatus Magnetominusculus sp. LBB02]|nr:methyl-accepting chemotaxis protein [Candidatus Magnetominusculus sp. LBB02]